MSLVKNCGSRNYTADFLKGILIFCVMFGHSVTMINSLRNVSWTQSIVNVFVTSFEMPLFILVSGYFLAFSLKNNSYKKVLFKRVVSIATPVFIWEGIPAIFDFFMSTVESGFSLKSVLKIIYKCVFPGKLWFLSAFLFCTVFVIILEWVSSFIKSDKIRLVCKIILYVTLIIILHFIDIPFSNVPFLFPFFLIGFVLSKYKLLSNPNIRKIVYALSILFVILYPFYKAENSFYLLGTYIQFDKIWDLMPIYIHRFLLSLSGCSAVYLIASVICKKFENSKFVLFLNNFGRKTMELYILSMFVQDFLQYFASLILKNTDIINDITSPLLFGPLFLVVLVAICSFVDYLVGKLPAFHRLLFGR